MRPSIMVICRDLYNAFFLKKHASLFVIHADDVSTIHKFLLVCIPGYATYNGSTMEMLIAVDDTYLLPIVIDHVYASELIKVEVATLRDRDRAEFCASRHH